MFKKWIPNGDGDFLLRARTVSETIARGPGKYEIDPAESEELSEKFGKFQEAYQTSYGCGRSAANVVRKAEARQEVERILRRIGNVVRANPRLSESVKIELGIRPRQKSGKSAAEKFDAMEAPSLRFVRAVHESARTPVHELEFMANLKGRGTKAAGADRLELYVGLIPPGDEIPTHPSPGYSVYSWYLRSYVRSPIRLVPPMARVPMRVVYWGRWADSRGEVGAFSKTAVGWIEGGVNAMLPGGLGMQFPAMGQKAIEQVELSQPTHGGRERTYVVAVMEARERLMEEREMVEQVEQLEDGRERRQIAG